ncbi:hypothetical protein C0585_07050 [Candidatus Woesearchaeota archaeon]|nr:MAG: hypothetical protein C0585_07050 [Candidatus Woesearchaeota archaeon]
MTIDNILGKLSRTVILTTFISLIPSHASADKLEYITRNNTCQVYDNGVLVCERTFEEKVNDSYYAIEYDDSSLLSFTNGDETLDLNSSDENIKNYRGIVELMYRHGKNCSKEE